MNYLNFCNIGFRLKESGARPDSPWVAMVPFASPWKGPTCLFPRYPTQVPRLLGDTIHESFIKEFLPIFGDVKPGGKDDLVALASKAKPLPGLRFDCGTEDFLLESNRTLHKEFTKLGIKHEYEEFPGDHNWEYWDEHIQEAIAFNLKNMGGQ